MFFLEKKPAKTATFFLQNQVTIALKWAQNLHRDAYRKRREILWLNLDGNQRSCGNAKSQRDA